MSSQWKGEGGGKNGSSSWYLRGSIFRVNTRTLLHSTRQRKSNSTWFRGPLSFGRADFVESANSSFRPSKISPDISWLYSMIPRPTQHFTSSAFFQTRCNSFVLSFQRLNQHRWIKNYPFFHGDTFVRWIFHSNIGGWIF